MTTRRNFMCVAAALPVSAAIPDAVSGPLAAGTVDPIFAAIHARRQARARYVACCDDWTIPNEEKDPAAKATGDDECRTTITALRTTPTTLAGLRAFGEFGAELAREFAEVGCGLCDYTPGIPLRMLDVPNVEEMYFATLERAVRLLLPT
ncbi:hypothetical protein EV667_0229 [Ancylobacter aquaticus]|uniref:Twin-arginine translocation signal domain-containing protein n=1 Tax=Ancylobacter aquaticus TaxID=100 RepID=A0A4R1IG60_ANCAQ|nr:hypothetical protein [Ancylobacter aquaticus]TCK30142.1 hypothetical protein EV667_0229 [Ancylobacter aquaticus]